MKALRISDYGAPLHIDEVPVPSPAPGQVLVENHFTSMNGVDPGRGMGYLRHVFQLQFPWTPGGDVSGRVAAVGEGVTDFKVGDEVFGYTRDAGAYAEFVVINAANLAQRPASISAEAGAAIALVSQTATQMLELSKIKTGQRLLIMGASGGVGSLAVQLARNAGVHVIATARRSKADALEQLGAEQVVDLSKQRLEDVPQVDAVLNLIGQDTVVPSYERVKKGGVAVTANRPAIAEEAARLGIEARFVETNVTTEGLNAFAALVTTGKIEPQIAAVTTLWSPGTLWAEHETEKIGKIVFSVRA
ncbi:NADP-dependent oxidoreductase [Occallatibacter riparius]|uniref:NADP-dependent oxidoreductase n=1 Tax=Occallatibacter riparius TaxID=1002689 RepID=A0A9J7BNB3_9BACT|nr:NADP-dependent oxidoreductase [Occallatibacter riparius]UWZ84203.1 NADP-dependent oxidoreductase [Occallatibacter riparius]